MSNDTILVTGATGFLGQHVVPALTRAFPARKIIAATSRSADLSRYDETYELLNSTKPDAIIHLAGMRGSEQFARAWTADCLVENGLMGLNLYKAAHQLGKVKRFVSVIGATCYPETAARPLSERDMWSGPHRADYLGLAMGSKLLVALADAFRWQVGIHSSVMVVPELYGEHSTPVDTEKGVVESMLMALLAARKSNAQTIEIQGDRNAIHDILYVGDVALLVPSVLENSSIGLLNISQGSHLALGKIADTICRTVGAKQRLAWLPGDPDALPPPCLDPHKMHSLGWSCPTTFETGLRRTMEWLRTEGRITEKVV